MGNLPNSIALTALLGLLVASQGIAAERHATMTVSAFVQARIEVEMVGTPSTLRVSADDVRAGFVDVSAVSALSVRTNSREGFAVDICPMHPDFSKVDISYGDGIARMTGEPVRLVRRRVNESRGTLRLSYRFHLRSTTAPGTYPWPLDIAAAAL
jgi:hypothetical protein